MNFTVTKCTWRDYCGVMVVIPGVLLRERHRMIDGQNICCFLFIFKNSSVDLYDGPDGRKSMCSLKVADYKVIGAVYCIVMR